MNRFISAVIICSFAGLASADENDTECFSYSKLQGQAQALASAPYAAPDDSLPGKLRKLDYDEMRSIRFNPKYATWRMERRPFQLQYFHRGGLQNDKITISSVNGARIENIPFSKKTFDYGEVLLRGSLDEDLGFSGFRIHYPLNRLDYLDEVLTFQGASYFRAVAKGQHYGLSARGAAVNVACDGPEEFPRFVSFWVEEPDTVASNLTIYALMDSPSLSGAFEMILNPGAETVMDIHATIYPRRQISRFGMAPLTSMFWFGENTVPKPQDFRSEVHDSDGLLIQTEADEWLWRPLENGAHIRYSSFSGNAPRGFGLFQRDRQFESYGDLEAYYHERPNLWVEPLSGWGAGEVRLIELPTQTEYNDNVVAFWAPDVPLEAEQPFEYTYRLHWTSEKVSPPALAYICSTRMGLAESAPQNRKFVIEFSHPGPDVPAGETPELEPVVSAENGQIIDPHLQYNRFNKRWRVFFDVQPDPSGHPVELRCYLASLGIERSEVWTCQWTP